MAHLIKRVRDTAAMRGITLPQTTSVREIAAALDLGNLHMREAEAALETWLKTDNYDYTRAAQIWKNDIQRRLDAYRQTLAGEQHNQRTDDATNQLQTICDDKQISLLKQLLVAAEKMQRTKRLDLNLG